MLLFIKRYGECEIHTEYFFCGVCHAEVKHNLKNISLHLGNVHNMTANQYEQQYGMIPDDEVVIPSLAQDSLEHPIVTGHDGFGSHFLLNSGQDQDNGYTQQVRNETVNPCTWTTF